jgi:hypothetical protein
MNRERVVPNLTKHKESIFQNGLISEGKRTLLKILQEDHWVDPAILKY